MHLTQPNTPLAHPLKSLVLIHLYIIQILSLMKILLFAATLSKGCQKNFIRKSCSYLVTDEVILDSCNKVVGMSLEYSLLALDFSRVCNVLNGLLMGMPS